MSMPLPTSPRSKAARISDPRMEGGSPALPTAPASSALPERLSWDPRSQPCVLAVDLYGATAHHSLRALFTKAEELSGISCSTPGEGVAVIEYLMAICFAAGVCPSSAEEWHDWVIHEQRLDDVADWLATQPDGAWDIFDPQTPLGGCSLLAPYIDKNGTGPAQLVIEYAGDYNQHFDHHHLEHDEPLPAADAFRAMLTQHVYAPYGRARMSGKELGPTITNLAACRLQGRIRIVALGRTLGETLRLNLYPPEGPAEHFNTSWTSGTIERRGFRTKAKPRAPKSSADLHSSLGRSILLRPARGERGSVVVDRVLIGAGEVLELDRERHLQDAVLSTTIGGVTKPLWPSPTRALWLDAHALYGAVKDDQSGLYARLRSLTHQRRGPGALSQLWAVGLLTKQATPVAWTQGVYPFAPGMAAHLYRASRRGSTIAEYIAWSLKRAAVVAAEIIFPAAPASDMAQQVARFDARWKFWPEAEAPFIVLLDVVIEAGAADEDDPTAQPLLTYAEELLTLARTHLANCLDSLPPNQRGYRARSRAEQRFAEDMENRKAPAEIRGEIAHD